MTTHSTAEVTDDACCVWQTAEKGVGEGGGDAAPQEEADGKSGETQEEVEASKEDGMEEDVSKDGCGQ